MIKIVVTLYCNSSYFESCTPKTDWTNNTAQTIHMILFRFVFYSTSETYPTRNHTFPGCIKEGTYTSKGEVSVGPVSCCPYGVAKSISVSEVGSTSNLALPGTTVCPNQSLKYLSRSEWRFWSPQFWTISSFCTWFRSFSSTYTRRHNIYIHKTSHVTTLGTLQHTLPVCKPWKYYQETLAM